MPTPPELPPDLEALLADIRADVADAISGGDNPRWFAEVDHQLTRLLVETKAHRARQRGHQADGEPRTFQAITARALKKLRSECGWTARELAEAMDALGFVTWKRITVAECEIGKRRLSFEELLGLSILFGLTVEDMITSLEEGEVLVMNERRSLTLDETMTLIRGHGPLGSEGSGILGRFEFQEHGRQIAGIESAEDDWRPVADRVRRRLEGR